MNCAVSFLLVRILPLQNAQMQYFELFYAFNFTKFSLNLAINSDFQKTISRDKLIQVFLKKNVESFLIFTSLCEQILSFIWE